MKLSTESAEDVLAYLDEAEAAEGARQKDFYIRHAKQRIIAELE